MSTKRPGGVKITTPVLTAGGDGSYELDIQSDSVLITVHHPASTVTTELYLFGENAQQFISEVAKQARAARKSRLRAVNE